MEHWKPVAEFPDHYEISNLGRCRRIKAGQGARLGIRAPCADGAGYRKFSLSVDGATYQRKAHRLVWEAFVGPIPKGFEINHLNGDKTDNRLDNLQLVNHAENILHSYRTLGRAPVVFRGEQSAVSKLTEEKVLAIRAMQASGMSQHKIAAEIGVTRSCVKHVLDGRTWRHI
jgi:hypothetical protein